ncbi:MAG: type II toxin-antitoxin system HicA family toxin [Nanoarchaeota archaeon]
MRKKRFIGLILIVMSLIILVSNVKITGAVIGAPISTSINFIAITLLVVGLILTSQRERNYAQEILEQRRYVDDTRELKKIARKMGYSLIEGYKEGTKIYNENEVLTVIPNHRKIEGRGTVKSILEALATGESSFRKRHSHV